MATIADLVAKLKIRASIMPDERLSPTVAELDDYLSEIIHEAVTQHNVAYTVATLPAAEEMLVIILAQIEICYLRAEKTVKDAPLTTSQNVVGTLQLDSPFNKNMKLAERLTLRYEELVTAMGLASGVQTVISQTNAYIKSDRLDRLFPFFAVPAAPPGLLTGVANSSTEIDLEWSVTPVEFFDRFFFFWKVTPGVYLPTYPTGNMTVPRISSSAILIYDTRDQTEKGILAQGFDPASDNYFMMVTKTQQNKYTYSSEIKVITPA
jgi:hypothetical protein